MFPNHKMKEVKAHKKIISFLSWNRDGLLGTSAESIKVWDIKQKFTQINEFKDNEKDIDLLDFNPENPNLVCGTGKEKTLFIYDTRTNEKGIKIDIAANTFCLNWGNSGNHIIASSTDNLVELIDLKFNKVSLSKQFNSEINDIKWYSSSKYIYISDCYGYIHIYDGLKFEFIQTIRAHTSTLYHFQFSPDFKKFAVSSEDSTISIWDNENLSCIQNVNFFESGCKTFSFTHDNKYLALASSELIIPVFDVKSCEVVHQIKSVNKFGFNYCKWHPKEHILAISSKNRETNSEGTLVLFTPY